MFNSFSACVTPSNFRMYSLFKLYTNIAFLTCKLLLILRTKVCDSAEVQLEIKGMSDKLKGNFEKYHSPRLRKKGFFF